MEILCELIVWFIILKVIIWKIRILTKLRQTRVRWKKITTYAIILKPCLRFHPHGIDKNQLVKLRTNLEKV